MGLILGIKVKNYCSTQLRIEPLAKLREVFLAITDGGSQISILCANGPSNVSLALIGAFKHSRANADKRMILVDIYMFLELYALQCGVIEQFFMNNRIPMK